jgi:hypothetical protein
MAGEPRLIKRPIVDAGEALLVGATPKSLDEALGR